MRQIRRTAALLLAAVCVLAALAGCGEKKQEPVKKKTDVEMITGRWETAFDVSETVRNLVTARDETMADADFAGLSLRYQVAFNADGTYTAGIPADGVEQLLRDTAARMAAVVREQTRQELAAQQHVAPEEIDDEQVNGYAGMIGVGTWEDYCRDQLTTALAQMDTVSPFEAEDMAGRYALKDGRLCLSADPAAEATLDDWNASYQLDEKSLTLDTDSTDGLPGFILFPATFARIG